MVFGGWSLCICEPMKCKRYCLDPDHIRVPIKIGEDWNIVLRTIMMDVLLEIILQKLVLIC